MMQAPIEDTSPWYKQFWPWFMIGLLLASVCFSCLFLYYAVTTRDSLVSDDYYKEGLAINQQLDKDRKARDLGLEGQFHFSPEGKVEVTLASKADPGQLPYLVLRFIHPTLSGEDQTLHLQPVANNRFQVMLKKPLTGRWYLDLHDPKDSWRLRGEIGLPNSTTIKLDPARN